MVSAGAMDNILPWKTTFLPTLGAGWVLQGLHPAVPNRSQASSEGLVRSSGRREDTAASGDASRLLVRGSHALSPAWGLREMILWLRREENCRVFLAFQDSC